MTSAHGSFDLLPDNFEEDDNFYKKFFFEEVSLINTHDISVTQLLNTNTQDLQNFADLDMVVSEVTINNANTSTETSDSGFKFDSSEFLFSLIEI